MGIRSFQNKVPSQGERVFVDPASTVIGEVALGDDSSVWPGAVVRGDMHRIVIGARTSVQDNAVLHITHDSAFNPGGFPLTLGDDVTVGHQAMLHGCTIGDRVMIGMQTMIMDGAVVESDVMLAAGSLVSPGKRLASGWLYRGRPARAVRELTAKEIEFLPYVAGNYVKLKDQYLDEA
ncbi:MAG TPA: gamma carbonic anhydrase family protein [Alcanivorax sp.]|jgi:carbonic anhydrase/acetyltransferase-like protein (isoleucine patch superfamily)|uniref:gamma carbonic anhydrase family protein n=2 Tax=Alcanivoracaceae TaxID=224372 RepID=UPI000798991C|nr:MAG: gamma carbonic anhydrase family protein [Alcanivorax sp. Nap_24]MBA4730444.1 gamma carbonic anhydrase family protein [Alcanivorax sp.]MBA4730455.1 gamma carbonic anhydrase family protein [Alcanivorax sp.]MBL4722752.1 gamma carbonic anhydrase family protein [Alcanivorax sp.]MBT75497.1 gamma carbonic anhydrase family protein [Alcanivorax sp.]|tara:strand:+ start:549 stop:1082 length:534 start_codon:yes stop_codon:yes gene_type:complete